MNFSKIRHSLAKSRDNSSKEIESLEYQVRDFLQRAAEENIKKNWLEEELRLKNLRQEWRGCGALLEQIDQALSEKNKWLLQAFQVAPDWFGIAEDPKTPGFLSLRFLRSSAMKFHFPKSMRQQFSNSARLERERVLQSRKLSN